MIFLSSCGSHVVLYFLTSNRGFGPGPESDPFTFMRSLHYVSLLRTVNVCKTNWNSPTKCNCLSLHLAWETSILHFSSDSESDFICHTVTHSTICNEILQTFFPFRFWKCDILDGATCFSFRPVCASCFWMCLLATIITLLDLAYSSFHQ